MKKKLIAFTIDESYIEPFIVAVKSFTTHHTIENYTIALVYSDISEKNLKKIRAFFLNNNISFIDKKIKDDFKDFKVSYHFNSVIFYRLLLPKIFENYEKILYIDSDILFLDNIDALFQINLENNILAAIPKHDYFVIPEHLQSKIQKYFASGLLLIDTKNFIDFKIYEKCLDFLKNEKYEMPDQDALNVTVDKWLELELSYGVETAFLEKNDDNLNNQILSPKIIQFSGSSKPWHFRNKHPYRNLYWKYLKMTSFKRYFSEDFTVLNVMKGMVPNKIKEFIKGKK